MKRSHSITEGGRVFCTDCWYNNQIRDMNIAYCRKISAGNPTREELGKIRVLLSFTGPSKS